MESLWILNMEGGQNVGTLEVETGVPTNIIVCGKAGKGNFEGSLTLFYDFLTF